MRRWVTHAPRTQEEHISGPQELVLVTDDIFAVDPRERPPNFSCVRDWHVAVLRGLAAAHWPPGAACVHQPIFVVPTRFPMILRDALAAYGGNGLGPADNIVFALIVRSGAMLCSNYPFFEDLLWPRKALLLDPDSDALAFEDVDLTKVDWILVNRQNWMPDEETLARQASKADVWRAQARAASVPLEFLPPDRPVAGKSQTKTVAADRPPWAR